MIKPRIIKTDKGYKLKFWNRIGNKVGKVSKKKGFKCKKCDKLIIGKFIRKKNSFILYHPECTSIKKSAIMIFYSQAKNIGSKKWRNRFRDNINY